ELHGKVTAFVLFSKPGASEEDIRGSDLWKKAALVPGVTAVHDAEGSESQVFQGQVSGQTMLYSPDRNLVFSGGITSARGHQGDNEGAEAIVRLVKGGAAGSSRAPVFGCALQNPSAKALKEDSAWKK